MVSVYRIAYMIRLFLIFGFVCFLFSFRRYDIPHAGRPPDYLSFLKQNYPWPVIHLFFSSPTRGITHFFMDTQNTTERVEEKDKRTNTGLGELQALEGGSLCDILCSSPCICMLSRACILRETSTKSLGMLTNLLTVVLPSSRCFLLLTVSFSGRLSQADCSLLFSFVNCLSLSSFPPPLPVLRAILPSCTLGGFRAKTVKEIL